MRNNKYSDLELATRFAELSQLFLNHYLHEKKLVLNFNQSWVTENVCNTVACHGGAACLILKELIPADNMSRDRYYTSGMEAINQYLGFDSYGQLTRWADDNPDLWGIRHGRHMFNYEGYRAFGFTKDGICTLLDIANWYSLVSRRILNKVKLAAIKRI